MRPGVRGPPRRGDSTREFGTASDDGRPGTAVYAGDRDGSTRTYRPIGMARWTRPFGSSGDADPCDVELDGPGHAYAASDAKGALEGTNLGFEDGFVRHLRR